ncbi:unnamed protein product [Medioppia subpectinata]|uniref:Cysteine dioxygenase n=1 Tax=Medioppia subpectinata TaxID=1979941 RepID=A0A7R9LI81_9ACAR|nr:unnamed protein product [Medioppia subpectinata]CAG2119052.1 unnamed protein product [Medioppia subpectinata]
MLLCWSEGQGSVIHDHSDAHCFMKILSGNLHETRFEWPDNTSDVNDMKAIDENELKTNDVAYINGKADYIQLVYIEWKTGVIAGNLCHYISILLHILNARSLTRELVLEMKQK